MFPVSVELRYGKIAEIDKGRVRVEFEELDGLLSPWLMVLFDRTMGDQEFDSFAIGELVACLVDRHGESGIVLGSTYSDENPPPVTSTKVWTHLFSDGTQVSYDKDTKTLLVDAKGPITIQAAADVTVDCAAGKNVLLGGGSDTLVKKSYLAAIEARMDANESAIVTAVNAAGPGGPAASLTLQTAFSTSKGAYETAKATTTTTKTKGG